MDSSANASQARTISGSMSSVQLNVIQTNEEAVIASKAAAFLDEER
jgi:acetate kinase